MKTSILTTTTNNIENAIIEKYIEIISVNVVVGTNVFSDFKASFSDFFGGYSDSYQDKLSKIYKIGVEKLKYKAFKVGSNAVVGITIDFDEIAGKGKSMFMLTLSGTAVVVKHNEISNKNCDYVSYAVDNEELELEILKRSIIEKCNKKTLLTADEWIYLLNFPIDEISENLLNQYLEISSSYSYQEIDNIITENIPYYFQILNKEIAVDILYAKLLEHPKLILDLIINCQLFSPKKVLEHINSGNIDLAIDCLKANKKEYTYNDLELMIDIIKIIDKINDKGKIENVTNLIGKSKNVFICPNGHKNDIDIEFCEHERCGLNIKGLSKYQINIIKNFKIKTESLQILLDDNKVKGIS